MKTIKEWLEILPEPQKTKAFANINNSNFTLLNSKSSSLTQALMAAFIWSRSNEGEAYWVKISEKIKLKEILKKTQDSSSSRIALKQDTDLPADAPTD